MVFRRDSKVDAFQRQISALRHQLGGDSADYASGDQHHSPLLREEHYRSELPELEPTHDDGSYLSAREQRDLVPYDDASPPVPDVPAIDALTSVIAHTTTWNGNLESSGSLHVHGRVEGTLTAHNDVFIAEEANVDAVVKAANVTVAGSVRGSIHCAERFEVLPRGRVAGDIRAPVIVVHEGALIAGDVAMAPAGETRGHAVAAAAPRIARGGD